ncbi:MAG: DUF349 domain-containing protein [Gammaproteobacteria bacterium]|nr:DUF349 domain-containing protein [Gammaproteobacteria bacterium]
MLENLFKPAWQSSSIEKRLKAISEMDGTSADSQEILTQLAADNEASICIAAIQKLTSVSALHEISQKHSNDSARQEAEKKVNELLGTKGSLSKDQYLDLLQRYPELTLRVALHAAAPSARAEAMQSLSKSQLFEVLAKAVYTDSRQLIAEMLTNIEELESAREILRDKDKKAERLLQAKIDTIRDLERQQAENLATVEKLIEQVEYLAGCDWQPEFKFKLLQNQNQWDRLGFEIDPDSNQRYQTARKIIDARFEEQSKIEETLQSQEGLIAEIRAFLENVASTDIVEAIATVSDTQIRLDRFSSEWQRLTDEIQPKSELDSQFKKIANAVQSAIQLVLQAANIMEPSETDLDESEISRQTGDAKELDEKILKLNAALKMLKWPANHVELKVATELKARLADWRNIVKATKVEHQQKLKDLHKTVSSITRLSRAGKLIRAKQLCERVEKKLEHYEGKERADLEERFEEARKTLGDMGDWKNFATEPKYIELCEAMENLIDSKQHPDNLVTEMKELQNFWKSLGHSDISEQYWPRFKEAADKVYQPCAEFFERRSEIRKTNLDKRQQYVEQMRKLFENTDWENQTDHNVLRSSVRSISDKFFNVKDVERKAGQKQWKQFSKIRNEIIGKLDSAYEQNSALKNELVQQAKELAEADVKEENLTKLKTLQFNWKQIGAARRAQDEKAWTEFKKQCDIVYNKVQELRQGQRSETDQKLNAYRDIIKAIQNLARSADNLSEADHQFSELQAKYAELPELPKQIPEKLTDSIQRDYRNACKQFNECHTRLVNAVRNQQTNALRQKAKLCEQLEALGKSPSAETLQDISQQWDAIELNDATLNQRIEARRESAQTDIDRAAIGDERRMLCIQLEIAKGVESPDEDKTLRMQYQLEQMSKSGLGQQVINSAEQLESMELDWLCMPGAGPMLQKQLNERFGRVMGIR